MHDPSVVAFVPNLFDRSRFGGRAKFIDRSESVAELKPSLVLVDLDRCEDPTKFVVEGVSVVGFGSHVQLDTQRSALDYGFDEVLTRSQFFKRLPKILDLD